MTPPWPDLSADRAMSNGDSVSLLNWLIKASPPAIVAAVSVVDSDERGVSFAAQ